MMVRDPACYSLRAGAAACSSRAHVVGETVARARWPGFLHFVEDVDRAPIEVRYRRGGMLWMAAGPGRVQRGDVVAVVMNDYDDALAAD